MPDETPPPPADAPAGGKVRVVSPWGEHGEADSSALDSLVAQGFRPETDQEQAAAAEDAKFGNRPLAAGAAGLARGLTIGLSDPLLTSTGLVAPETLKGLREHNAGASAVGDVAGTALGLLDGAGELSLVKGVAAAGEGAGELAARVVGQGAIGTAAKIATRGAVEGTLYGVGNAVSDEALGDPQAVGQKLLASAGMGALLGVGGSAIGEALGAAFKPVAKAAAKAIDNLPDQLGDLASERYLKAGGAIQGDINKLSPQERADLIRVLRGRGHVGGFTSAKDVLGSVNGDLAARAVEVGKELDLDPLADGDLTPATENDDAKKIIADALDRHGQAIGDTLRDADRAGARFDASDLADRIQDFIKNLNPAERRIIKPKIDNVLGDLNEALGRNYGFAQLNDLKGTLQADAEHTASNAAKGLYGQLVGIFKSEIDNQLEGQISPQAFQNFLSVKRSYGLLKGAEELAEKGKAGKDIIAGIIDDAGHDSGEARLYGTLSTAQRIAQKGADRNLGNRFISLTDYGLGGAAGLLAGGPAGVVLGAGAALGNKVLRERGPAMVATGLDALAKSPVFNKLAQGFQTFAQTTLQQSPRVFGEYSGILANAAARGADDLLLTHAALSERDPNYRATMQAAGLDYSEDPRQVAQRAQTLAVLGHHLDGFGADLDASLGGALEGEKAKAAFDRLSGRGEQILSGFDQQAKAIRELTEDPNALADRLTQAIGPLADHAPNVAAAMSTTASNAVAFLNAKLPKSTDPLQEVPALQRPYSPSDTEKARFERYVAAVANPTAALEQLRNGEVTKESIEALQAVYPAFYAELQQRAMERLSTVPGQLDYRKRVALSRLLGQPLDASMRPQRLLAAQAAHAVAPKGPAPHPSRAAQKALPGATLSQQLEGRGV